MILYIVSWLTKGLFSSFNASTGSATSAFYLLWRPILLYQLNDFLFEVWNQFAWLFHSFLARISHIVSIFKRIPAFVIGVTLQFSTYYRFIFVD
jgi:hypothetical protein